MAKFYVRSGPKQCIVLADTDHAAVDAFLHLLTKNNQEPSIILGSLIRVSEEGFEHHADDSIFCTESMLKHFTKQNGGTYEQ